MSKATPEEIADRYHGMMFSKSLIADAIVKALKVGKEPSLKMIRDFDSISERINLTTESYIAATDSLTR